MHDSDGLNLAVLQFKLPSAFKVFGANRSNIRASAYWILRHIFLLTNDEKQVRDICTRMLPSEVAVE